ncbi:hypothetical protein HXX76_010631 [Chlamydomonas incerta]|uniref:Flagellar associated protein n=1 Tax=Chlamydomonas incerta TaxID=51695 RepID=A0A835SMQ9_CHLIN|nr:hypothetical protein HXX76_010631 [Chlamydomonas incerta]|eukprot:KAG2429849.1 hypothetical protein HXX76_010631 [Chlamydomonas incerta]
MAPTDGGTEASKRMHEYLLSKQRKQEEYWLRKYGKVVQAAPPSVGKPSGNPRLPAIGTINSGINSGAPSNRTSNAGLPSAEPSGSMLPPIAGAQQAHGGAAPAGMLPPHNIRHQQPRGQAPIFQAKEPVRDFFQRNAPRAGRGGGGGPAARDEYGNVIPPSRRPPEPLRRGPNQQPLPRQLPPLAGGGEQGYGSPQMQMQMQMQQGGDGEQQQLAGEGSWSLAAQQQQGYASSPDVGGGYGSPEQQQYGQPQYGSPQGGYGGSPGAAGGRLAPLQYEASAPALGAGVRTSYNGSPGAAGGVSPYHQKPLRNLEMELTVIKAIKAREDVLERLRIAGGKLDAGFGGAAPVVLSPVDPLVRLFYRLVGTLRQRTLDAVESIAAWRRKVSPSEPFVYYGVDYLAAIGPDCGFLDSLPFLRSRLSFGKAADDPFLVELTPDGIPIEEATTCDLRRGGQRFSSDALRIRMARKILAQYCGRPLPHEMSSCMMSEAAAGSAAASPAGAKAAAGAAAALAEEEDEEEDEEEQEQAASPSAGAAVQTEPIEEGDGEEDEEEAESEVASPAAAAAAAASMPRAASPPAVPSPRAAEPPTMRAITPPAAVAVAVAVAAAAVAVAVAKPASSDDLEPLPEPEPEAEPEPEVQPQPQPQPEPERSAAEQQLPVFEDDGDFIDFAIGAIIHSLEQPHADSIEPGTFTVAGWEIDRQLEEVVSGIAASSSSSAPAAPAAAALPGSKPPSRAGAHPVLGGGAGAGSKPPSRGAPAVGAAKPPSRGGPAGGSILDRISPVKPPSRGAAGPPSTSAKSPVRVHLRPGSRGVGVDLSMDGEGPAMADLGSEEAGGDARSPVRVHLRPGSRGLAMNLSMDGEGEGEGEGAGLLLGDYMAAREAQAVAAAAAGGTGSAVQYGLPAITEDQSAYFAGEDEEEESTPGGSRPPVRVHLKPHSRGLDVGISMDGEGPGMGDLGPLPPLHVDGEDDEDEEEEEASTKAPAKSPVRVHLRPGSRGVGVDLSMDGEAKRAPVSAPRPLPPALSVPDAAARSPVRVHLRPGSRGVGMDVSMDGEAFPMPAPPAPAPADASGRSPVRVHLRPGSRGLAMNLSMDGEGPAESDVGASGAPGLPAITEDQSAYFGAGEGEEEEATPGGSRPPVRVHLKPHSRGLDMGISMDGEAFPLPPAQQTQEQEEPAPSEQAAPAQADEPAEAAADRGAADEEQEEEASTPAAKSPVRVHLRPGSRGLAMNLSMDGEGPAEADVGESAAPGLPAITEDQSAYFGAEDEAGAAKSPVRVHLRPHSRGVDMGLSMDGEGPAAEDLGA